MIRWCSECDTEITDEECGQGVLLGQRLFWHTPTCPEVEA